MINSIQPILYELSHYSNSNPKKIEKLNPSKIMHKNSDKLLFYLFWGAAIGWICQCCQVELERLQHEILTAKKLPSEPRCVKMCFSGISFRGLG